MELNSLNYYSNEADLEYMSCSQIDEFKTCEAAALARIQGRYTPKKSQALLVGSYFHTYMEGKSAHEAFLKENFDDVFKTKLDKQTGEKIITGKYAAYDEADRLIQFAERDPVIRDLIEREGEVEKIMTGMLFGVYPWKIRIDKYFPDTRIIIDWKTTASIRDLQWDSERGERVSFIENFGYIRRAAIYSEIEKQYTGKSTVPPFFLVCISKQNPPDKEIINLTHQQRYEMELENLHDGTLARIKNIKDGLTLPKRCGVCEYCRATKRLTNVLNYWELETGNSHELEDDYAINDKVEI